MRLLWFCLLLHTAFHTDASFGTPFLVNAKLCQPWNCLSATLGIPNSLPPREQFGAKLKALLPSGPWQDAADIALKTCYYNRQRNYVGTCPGQALLHCTVDNLIQNCPEENWRKNDGCYPVSTLALNENMFTQSRYKDLEKNLAEDKRPAWFLRNYFNAKCCDLPEFINTTTIKECGFANFIHYHEHTVNDAPGYGDFMWQPTEGPVTENIEETASATNDPLQCCDMAEFVLPSMRDACGFKPSWDQEKRLVVEGGPSEATTKRPPPVSLNKDVKVVPLSCEKEECIFQKLNIVSESGAVDRDAFSKLLDNFTAAHPVWNKARARVITQCLTRVHHGYVGDCEVNKLLACTLDVLSENCPYTSKHDTCRHSRRNNTVCQISSSMYRPKNRRAVCGLPNLVNSEVLTSCGVTSVSRTEYVPDPPIVRPSDWKSTLYACKDNQPATDCLIASMGSLNPYGFMDYFKMKDRIRQFTTNNPEWAPLTEHYMNVFIERPKYKEYCNTPRKLLNVLDAMLSTCPISKRKNTPECNSLFDQLKPTEENQRKVEQIQKHFNHMFIANTPTPSTIRNTVYTKKNPIFDFGVLNSPSVPPVITIDLKKKTVPVILPVYMRLKTNPVKIDTSALGNSKDGVFQPPPYLWHGKIPSTNTVTPVVSPGLP